MHKCCKNWQGTYIAMETDGIVADFQKSVEIHGLKYARLIEDDDSSVHRRLIETLPYGPNLLVQKIECRTRIFRNYDNSLKDICMKKNFGNVELRSLIRQNLLHLRTAVTKAVTASSVSFHDSLIEDVDTNCVELYNSHIAKAIGGKHSNLCLKQLYQGRCQSAVIVYNTKGKLHRVIHKTLKNKSPGCHIKKFTELKKGSAKKDNARKFQRVNECIEEKKNGIECRTRVQSSKHKSKIEKRKRLTASNFRRICKLRTSTSFSLLVQSVLYLTFVGTTGTKWGLEHEHNILFSGYHQMISSMRTPLRKFNVHIL
ncbi:hypothetical protein PR048_008469 [Dryococelus australis]|uniref:Mutator-like transposase domain-containing protein n=1 Tax=Dryococelus australis TaxID=614101 RepID=A0ABQ9HX70_9NEOP|nr:hypothetical protein PR048_008469 [Dryococelus australis]